jgi:hypothetical protein
VSLREQDQVLKIDRETKDVVWTLGRNGDFSLLDENGEPSDDWFAGQHDVKVEDGAVILHDNGTHVASQSADCVTRALVLSLDTDAMTAKIAYQWTEPGWSEAALGGLDRLSGGGYTIAMGHYANNAHTSALVDVTDDGQVAWRAQFEDPRSLVYRSQRVDGCAAFPEAQSLCANSAR